MRRQLGSLAVVGAGALGAHLGHVARPGRQTQRRADRGGGVVGDDEQAAALAAQGAAGQLRMQGGSLLGDARGLEQAGVDAPAAVLGAVRVLDVGEQQLERVGAGDDAARRRRRS